MVRLRTLREPIGTTPDETARYLAGLFDSAQTKLELTGVKQVARLRRRTAPEAFDEAWSAATGERPAWLEFDPTHLGQVIAWINKNTWRESREFFREHQLLQTPATRQMIDELDTDEPTDRNPDDPPSILGIHQQLLVDSQTLGIDEAFAAYMGLEAVGEWIDSDFSQTKHEALRADLRRARSLDAFREDDVAARLRAAFQLVDRGEMSLALDSLRDDFRLDWSELLEAAQHSQDIARFDAIATLAGPDTDDPVEMNEITAARVLAATLTDRMDAATTLIHESDAPEVRASIERALVAGIADHSAHTPALVAALEVVRSGVHAARP